MATTTTSNIVVPEIWAPDITRAREKHPSIVNSGIMRTTPRIQERVNSGGWSVHLPYMNPIAGSSEVITGAASPMTVNNQTGDEVIAPRMIRGKTWGWDDIVDLVRQDGEDLIDTAVREIGKWEAEDDEEILLSVLQGCFATAMATTHSVTAGAVISAENIINASRLIGDNRRSIVGILAHSHVVSQLEKADLIAAYLGTEDQSTDEDITLDGIPSEAFIDVGTDLLGKLDANLVLCWVAAFTVLTSSLIAMSQDKSDRRKQ